MNYYHLLMLGTITGCSIFSLYAAYKSCYDLKFTIPKIDSKNNNDSNTVKSIKEIGLTKTTNVLSVFQNGTIRTKEGGYIRGYRFKPSESFYSSENEIADLYNKFAFLLTTGLPKDTVMQVRFNNFVDSGNLLNEQIIELGINSENLDGLANELREESLEYYFALAQGENFRTATFDVWLLLPSSIGGDKIGGFFNSLKTTNSNRINFREALTGNRKTILSRIAEQEELAYEKAAAHFQNFERNFPTSLEQKSYSQICVDLRFSHNPNATSIPIPPQHLETDWQSFISRTPIRHKDDWFLWHGNTPISVVSLFEPPESNEENPTCYPGMMQFLTTNPTLKGRISVVSEFICADKDESVEDLKKDLKNMKRANTRPNGQVEFKDEKVKRAFFEKQGMLKELTSPGKALTSLRFHVLVFGDEVLFKEDKRTILKDLRSRTDDVIRLIHENMQGSQADYEDKVALRNVYEKLLIGEITPKIRHREIKEQASSLSCFIPAQSDWTGITESPHNIFINTSGDLVGVNLLRNPHSATPLTLILGSAGSGKSVLGAEMISGFMSTVPNARVRACDYGGSLAPLVNLFNGRYFRFNSQEKKTINVWDYEGLGQKMEPSDEQVELVVKDTLLLLGADETTELGKDFAAILEKCVRQVYSDEVPRNSPGARHEPRLSHLLRKLSSFPFESTADRIIANRMETRLANFENNPWVDAPTHESYRIPSRFDVYELSSLEKLPEALRSCLAFRIGAKVGSGDEDIEGKNPPTLVVFDEVHELVSNEYLHYTLRGAERTTRHGRKKNKVPVLITHSLDDIKGFPGFLSNIGSLFVGKQDDINSLKKLRNWNDRVINTVANIENQKGVAHQFLFSTGQGEKQKFTTIQVYLSPVSLWTYTSDPPEDEARKVLSNALPHWSWANVLVWLAKHYPRGLTFEKKTQIDRSLFNRLIRNECNQIPAYAKYIDQMEKEGVDIYDLPEDVTLEDLSIEGIKLIDKEFSKIEEENFSNIFDKTKDLDYGVGISDAVIVEIQGE